MCISGTHHHQHHIRFRSHEMQEIWGKELFKNYLKYKFKFGQLGGSTVFQSFGGGFVIQLLKTSEINKEDVTEVLIEDLKPAPGFKTTQYWMFCAAI